MHGQAPRYLAYHFITSSDVASRLRLRETFFVFLVTRVQRYVFTKLDVPTAFQFWENRRHVLSDRQTDRRTDVMQRLMQRLWGRIIMRNERALYLPVRRYASAVIAIVTCLSVRLSVCPSLASRYCVKRKKASVMISSLSGSPTNLVFWRQISSRHSKGHGSSRAGGSLKQRWGGKIQPFSRFKHQYLKNGSR